VVFTQGCGFHCPYCHNPALARGSGEAIPEGKVFAFLRERARLLDGVVVSGGEPTLQGGLLDFVGEAKSLGYQIKLDTNGSRPQVLKEALRRGAIDYAAMDVKADPDNCPPELAPPAESRGVRESIEILKGSDVPHEFRTTVVSPFVAEESLSAICRALGPGERLWLQELNLRHGVLSPEFMALHPEQPGREELGRLRVLALSHSVDCRVR
jgi:pyruvate formate lyase activating enzyme